ncbi:MAG: class I SAM-dependent methyltransferase [bacterium]
MEQERVFLNRDFNKDAVLSSYATVAKIYNLWSWLTETKAARMALQMAQIQDGQTILEVAVGTGVVFEKITKQNPRGTNVGIELSSNMLERAVKRLHKGNPPTAYLQIGSAYHLPFRDDHFDLVVNNFMLDLLPEADFEPILLEFKRVLKKSGRVAICTMAQGNKKVNQIWSWISRRFPELLTGCRPVSMRPYLEQAGFTNVQVVQVSQNTFASEVVKAEA